MTYDSQQVTLLMGRAKYSKVSTLYSKVYKIHCLLKQLKPETTQSHLLSQLSLEAFAAAVAATAARAALASISFWRFITTAASERRSCSRMASSAASAAVCRA